MEVFDVNDIIYALATPWAKGAIAVVRVSGEGCISIVSKHFKSRKKLEDVPSFTAVYGELSDIDRCIITVFRNGHGYTGQESLEISCHGGLETIKATLELMSALGFRQAKGGEFTLRAFVNGKMDLTRAEAVNELINSRGKTGAMLALNRLNGALWNRINEIKDILTGILATVEVQLDYAEDEIDQDLTFPREKLDTALKLIRQISMSYSTGRLYSQGAVVVLAGSTNAGKSSLFNLFLKQERAIVSSTAGTTRDFIESSCEIDGIPVRLYDTAGLRESSDGIEQEGINRSRALLESADLIIYLVDASEPVTDKAIMSDPRTICVVNKTDIAKPVIENCLYLSVKTQEGFNNLCNAISAYLKKDLPEADTSSMVIENKRQKEDLERAVAALETVEDNLENDIPLDIVTMGLQEAMEALGEITGEVTTDDILDRIFADFCVGK